MMRAPSRRLKPISQYELSEGVLNILSFGLYIFFGVRKILLATAANGKAHNHDSA